MENRPNNAYSSSPHIDQLPHRDLLPMPARTGAGQGPGCAPAASQAPSWRQNAELSEVQAWRGGSVGGLYPDEGKWVHAHRSLLEGSWLGASRASFSPLPVPSRVIWYSSSHRFREHRLPCWGSESTAHGPRPHGLTIPPLWRDQSPRAPDAWCDIFQG